MRANQVNRLLPERTKASFQVYTFPPQFGHGSGGVHEPPATAARVCAPKLARPLNLPVTKASPAASITIAVAEAAPPPDDTLLPPKPTTQSIDPEESMRMTKEPGLPTLLKVVLPKIKALPLAAKVPVTKDRPVASTATP